MVKKQVPDQKDERNDHPDQKHKEGRVMLTGIQLYQKIKEYASMFKSACYSGQWARAKYLYLQAHYTALMVELDEDQISEFFGNDVFIPEDEEPQTGLFPQELVEEAGWKTVLNHLTMDELLLHPREQIFQHGEGDCITAICTQYHPEGIPVGKWLQAIKK